jgi:tetraacyldisaccharide 4'-kinase
MQAPRFWDNPPDRPGWQATALAPLAVLYAAGTARRLSQSKGFRPAVPVVCVGNLNAGGTGKTPTVIALVERCLAAGQLPQVVSRGHGGRLEGPVQVDPARHTAEDVGDEPLLLSAFAPVWVARDRAEGARAAEAAGAGVILLDDGFQNPSVAKDLSIIVVDAAAGFGNGRVIPAGPLREPVETGLGRADMVVSIGDAAAQAIFRGQWGRLIPCPLLTATLVPLRTGMDWAGLRTLAFAGIGRPAKFFRTLRDLGADIVRAVPLGDHQPLTSTLLTRMETEAKMLGAQLVTTEKDAVRLPASFRPKVLTLPVRLRFDNPGAVDSALAQLPSFSSRMAEKSS